jgi:hypothetical protein
MLSGVAASAPGHSRPSRQSAVRRHASACSVRTSAQSVPATRSRARLPVSAMYANSRSAPLGSTTGRSSQASRKPLRRLSVSAIGGRSPLVGGTEPVGGSLLRQLSTRPFVSGGCAIRVGGRTPLAPGAAVIGKQASRPSTQPVRESGAMSRLGHTPRGASHSGTYRSICRRFSLCMGTPSCPAVKLGLRAPLCGDQDRA